MDKAEAERETRCTRCGVHITTSGDRVFPFGEESVLCETCALAGGGMHEEEHDRWTDPPDATDDLAIERDP